MFRVLVFRRSGIPAFRVSVQAISPPKMRGLILRRNTGTVSVEVFTFHVHLAFERHTGTEGRELYFRAVFIL